MGHVETKIELVPGPINVPVDVDAKGQALTYPRDLGQAFVNVPWDPPEGTPTPSGLILCDNRAALQAATTESAARDTFDDIEFENYVTYGDNLERPYGWSFSTNFDGNGTHAMRAGRKGWGSQCLQTETYLGELVFDFSDITRTEIYSQVKMYLGRHGSDPGDNVPYLLGTIDEYDLSNTICNDSGQKTVLHHRNGGARVDLYWTGRHYIGDGIVRMYAESSSYVDYWFTHPTLPYWNVEAHEGEHFTFTVYIRAETSPGANDGIYAYWIDDTMWGLIEDLEWGTTPFTKVTWTATCQRVPFDCMFYMWDFVSWSPP